MLGLLRDVAVDVLEVPLPDLFEQVALVLGPEGVVALQHHEQEDAQAPQVRVVGHVVLFGDDFGGHVGRRPAKGIDGRRRHRLQTKPEVDQFELLVPVQQDVLGLYVAVHEVEGVQVADGFGDGPEELLGLALRHAVLGLREQVVVERVGPSVLLDQVDLGRTLNDFEQPGDDRVVQFGEDVDLPF